MAKDDYIHVKAGEDYKKITHIDGIRTTYCANRFEIVTPPTSEINEQQAVQTLREWIKWRNEKVLSVFGCVSE